jgi:TPR repeat protein
VALEAHNKPDEIEEALQYYRMLASRSRSPEPDLTAAVTIANFYYYGYRGVRQDLRLALKYYEICGDYNHWEGGGLAGLMHVWGIGMTPEERDLDKAYSYFRRGTPGGLNGCIDRLQKKKRQGSAGNKDGEVVLCDRHSINGMGLLHLFGVEGLIERDVDMARKWFETGKDMGDPDSTYNYAMLRLGWMVTELKDIPANVTADEVSAGKPSRGGLYEVDRHSYMTYRSTSVSNGDPKNYNGPLPSDIISAVQNLQQAASKGHLQAKHKLGMLHATGVVVPKQYGSPTKAVTQSCASALRYFKGIADSGHTVSRRNRAAWKQYNAGDYESSLRNYLASAETGSEIGQVNAAFLFEQGHCLGMTRTACTHASIRLWRAAARQGNLEACLRVGDFFFYGRMMTSRGGGGRSMSASPPPKSKMYGGGGQAATLYDREEYLSSLERQAFYFIPGPYRWTRYVLYPEELFVLTNEWLSKSFLNLWRYVSDKLSGGPIDDKETDMSSAQDACPEKAGGTCSPEWDRNEESASFDNKEEEYEHMAIAAQYYRKAAEEHNSARANFNLGFMHEWGLGLSQDFPLAKRHYDLAGEGYSNKAAAIALFAMNIHQKAVKFAMYLERHVEEN